MPDYPRPCPKCGVVTEEEGFAVDRSKPSGRKSCCKSCDRGRRKIYYAAHKEELYARRAAAREARRQAELAELAVEQRKRVATAKRIHAAQVRRQKEFLRSIGVPDVSPEEIA